MALLVGAFWEWGTYYTAEGDWYEAVWVNLGFTRVAFASERYEFADYFHQFYHGHFSLWYHLEKILGKGLGRASFWVSLATIPAWELFEERVLRSAPVSAMDMAWAALGVFLADAQREGAMDGWGFRFRWLPLEGDYWEENLNYVDLDLGSKLYYALFAVVPGNFNHYTFGLNKKFSSWEIELGVSAGDRRNRLRPEEPLWGWACFELNEEGLKLETERLFARPEALPSWEALPYLRIRLTF